MLFSPQFAPTSPNGYFLERTSDANQSSMPAVSLQLQESGTNGQLVPNSVVASFFGFQTSNGSVAERTERVRSYNSPEELRPLFDALQSSGSFFQWDTKPIEGPCSKFQACQNSGSWLVCHASGRSTTWTYIFYCISHSQVRPGLPFSRSSHQYYLYQE